MGPAHRGWNQPTGRNFHTVEPGQLRWHNTDRATRPSPRRRTQTAPPPMVSLTAPRLLYVRFTISHCPPALCSTLHLHSQVATDFSHCGNHLSHCPGVTQLTVDRCFDPNPSRDKGHPEASSPPSSSSAASTFPSPSHTNCRLPHLRAKKFHSSFSLLDDPTTDGHYHWTTPSPPLCQLSY
jgi:hypothetical protein